MELNPNMHQHELIQNDIFAWIEKSFEMKILSSNPIQAGFANLKWKVVTNRGIYFVKQYNKVRYRGDRMHSIPTALKYQNLLAEFGVPCPKILSYKRQQLLKTSREEHFVVTEFCDGTNIKPGEINERQSFSLGKSIGLMHKTLKAHAMTPVSLQWDLFSKQQLLKKWEANWKEALDSNDEEIICALESQKRILERFNESIFSTCERGWIHWDLHVENILFHDRQVSALLDFDRVHYVYTEFDISRPILSCTFNRSGFNNRMVKAFLDGYSQTNEPVTLERLALSIRLAWWKEMHWVSVKHKNNGEVMERFVKEMIWIGELWDNIEELLSDCF